MDYFLSICIPTYNGGENLKYNIEKLIKLSIDYNIGICISDNASNDGTSEYLDIICSKYKFITYNKNKKNLGIAYNFDKSLRLNNSRYYWLLGDDDEIVEKELKNIIMILKLYRPCICVVNGMTQGSGLRVKGLNSHMYTNHNEALEVLGEHMSWMSTLILSNELVNSISMVHEKNSFPHLISVLKFLEKDCKLYWYASVSVKEQVNSQKRYQSRYLDIFISDWYKLSSNLYGYSDKSKMKFCRSIEKRAFKLKRILGLRAQNILNMDNLNTCKSELKFYSIRLRCVMFITLFIPVGFLKWLYIAYKKRRKIYFE